MSRKKTKFLGLVCTAILIFSVLTAASGALASYTENVDEVTEDNIESKEEIEFSLKLPEIEDESSSSSNLEEYDERSPIRINNNTHFADLAADNEWPGDGSETDPYVIDGYDIDGDGYGYGIFIGNVTDHFIVQDNTIQNARGNDEDWHENSGIFLYNTTNGELVANDPITENDFGIRFIDSEGNTVVDNNLTGNEGEGWNDGHGIYIENSEENIFENNIVSDSEDSGFFLENSNSNELIDNEVYDNGEFGIYLDETMNNVLEGNEIEDDGIWIQGEDREYWDTHVIDESNTVNDDPVYYWVDTSEETVPEGAGQVILVNTTEVVVENQDVGDGDVGITLAYSNNNILRNNTVIDNFWHGIHLENSHRNDLINNTVEENEHGIFFLYSSDNTITQNEVHYNDWHGISLRDFSTDNDIIDNNASHNGVRMSAANAIYVRDDSNGNTIENNFMEENRRGVFLRESSNNIIENNTVLDSEDSGIRLFIENENNEVINNYVENSGLRGIGLRRSDGNTITDNTVIGPDDEYAIEVSGSEDTTVLNNQMEGSGLGIDANTFEGYNTHEIDESNTVNDDTVYYWRDQDGGTIPSDAGQVIISNSTDIVVEDLNVSDASIGINVGFSEDITISNNIANDGYFGIRLQEAHNNTLIGNEMSRNIFSGLYIYESDSNEVVQNTISETIDLYGVYLFMGDENMIYHNNIIDNEFQAYSWGSDTSEWDNGYPDGGNYWSDYEGIDHYHGEDRDLPGSDGIGDEEYEGTFVTDEYPLIEPATTPHVRVDHPNDHPDEDLYISEEDLEVELNGMYRYADELNYEIRLDQEEWIDLGSDSSYTFDDVADGEYTLDVRVTDDEGHSNYNSVEFMVDNEEPEIDITSPEDGAILNSDMITITWSGYDDMSGIDHFELRLNDEEWMEVGRANSHTFTGLSDGEHHLEIRARNHAELESTDELTFEIATESPILSITAPEEGYEPLTYEEEFTIEGETESNNTVYVNGEQIQVDENGEFIYETTLIDGQNYFHVVSENEFGNTAEITVSALYLPEIQELWNEIEELENDLIGQIDDLESDLMDQIDELRSDMESKMEQLEGDILDELDELQQDMIDEIEYLESQLNDLESNMETRQDELEDELNELEDELDELRDELDDEVDDLESELINQLDELETEQTADIETARNLAIVGLIIAVIALVIAVVMVQKKRSDEEEISMTSEEDESESIDGDLIDDEEEL